MSALGPFAVTFFDHKSARFKREQMLTPPELVEMIEASTAERKDLLPWVKFAVFGNLTSAKGSLRHDANVQCVTGCEADYDGELISFDEGKDKIEKAGVEAVIYTSPSHLPDKPRYRILCRFSEQLMPERRAQMVARLNGLFHGTLAAESFTLSQSYYYGHVVDADGNPVAHKENGAFVVIFPTEYRVELIEGQPLDLCDELDRGAIGKSGRSNGGGGDPGGGGDYTETQELVRRIISGESLHPSVASIAGKYARKNWPIETCIELVGSAFTAAEQPRYGGRWQECLDCIHDIYRKEEAARKPPPRPGDLILSSAEFIADFVPPDYVVEGVLQRRFLYSLTGKTGAGKTAIMLLLAAHVALGKAVGDCTIEIGKVLYLAGENADDVRMRWIAMAQQMDFDINKIDVHFIAGTFKLSEMHNRICTEIARIGEITLLLTDTSAAFFEGDNENDNKQAGDHARRMRRLIEVPGHPCVIVACHPTKNAADDKLTPRGGGAFLAEIDGNLTAHAGDGSIEVGTQGKFRGPDFAPLNFHLRTVTHERLKDSKGRLIPTVVASPLSEIGREDIAKAMRSHEDEMLVALLDPANRKASQAELARRLGWKMRNGEPYQVLVGRVLNDLKKDKLITITRREINLTKEGHRLAKQLSGHDTE